MKNLKFVLAAGACTTLAALSGCQQTTQETRSSTTRPEPRNEDTKVVARPAAQPRSEGRATWGRMALPTGNESTSAILVERFNPPEVTVGQVAEYQIRVTNLTDTTLKNVSVSDEIPATVTVKESSPAGTARGSLTSWGLGDLGPRESKTITYRASASAPGSFTSCAEVKWNNLLCATTNVVQPALAITKTITPESNLNCQPITATIEVRNTGSGTATNVVITDNLAAGLTTNDGKSTVSIPVGNLAAGQSATKTITLKATKTGRYENMASVTADGGLTARSTTVATVVKQPVLAIECKCGGNVYLGRDGQCTITVRNTGDACVEDARLNVSSNGTVTMAEGGTMNAGNGMWNLGRLCAGESKTVRVNVRPGSGGNVNLTANASGTCAAAASTTCSFSVVGVPDIGTGISDNDGVVNVNDPHTYNFTVVNQGQIDLTEVKVVGTFDDATDFISSTWPGGQTATGKTQTWNIGTVKVGERKSFSIVITSKAPGEHWITTVTSSKEINRTSRNDEVVNYIK